jgi:hypothetical protein
MPTTLRKRRIWLIRASCVLVLLLGGVSGSQAGATGDIVAASPEAAKAVNVIVINMDPVLKTRGGLKLHGHMKWSDPWQLTDKMVSDARAASQGFVNYRVVEKIEHDGFPTFRNGFTYTEDTFLAMWEEDRDKADKGMTSFQWLFTKFDLAARIRALNASEIWLWGAPYFAWDELHWKIPGDRIAYQTENPWRTTG